MGLIRRSDDGCSDRSFQQVVTTVTISRVSMTRITATTVKSQVKLVIVTSARVTTAVTIDRRRTTAGGVGLVNICCIVCGGGRGRGRRARVDQR